MSYIGFASLAATSHHQAENFVASITIFRKCATASYFDIIRMCANCQYIHFFHNVSSQTQRKPIIFQSVLGYPHIETDNDMNYSFNKGYPQISRIGADFFSVLALQEGNDCIFKVVKVIKIILQDAYDDSWVYPVIMVNNNVPEFCHFG